MKPWDRRLLGWIMLCGVAVLLVAGLAKRRERFGWSPAFGWPVNVLALVLLLAGYALSFYALIENRFFSSEVRTPSAKLNAATTWCRAAPTAGCGIPVTGGLLTYLAAPLLDSPSAFLPTALVVALTIIRTALEDRTLQAELDGYREYTRRVRYRLLLAACRREHGLRQAVGTVFEPAAA